MKHIKKLVMTLTISRIFGAVALLFITPLTALFYVVYTVCVVTDMIDGPIARKWKVTSNLGALLDSAADFFFAMVVLIIFIPILALEMWMVYLIAIVLITRFVGFGIGYVKYRTFTFLHTYANKGAGVLLAFFPVFYGTLGLAVTIIILFIAAILSALEELIITIKSKELNRNITSMFTSSEG